MISLMVCCLTIKPLNPLNPFSFTSSRQIKRTGATSPTNCILACMTANTPPALRLDDTTRKAIKHSSTDIYCFVCVYSHATAYMISCWCPYVLHTSNTGNKINVGRHKLLKVRLSGPRCRKCVRRGATSCSIHAEDYSRQVSLSEHSQEFRAWLHHPRFWVQNIVILPF
jgi:hypothetical protein